MSAPNALPYIGSKISLISNAGIRYEGVLFNINTHDSTVGLSNVRTFGTEGRKPGAEVAPSEELYDYIVFRGKDIQDLTVSDPSPPEDPAIVAINPMPSPTAQSDLHGGHHQGGPLGIHHHSPSNYMMGTGPQGRMGGPTSSMVMHHPPAGNRRGGGPVAGRPYNPRMGPGLNQQGMGGGFGMYGFMPGRDDMNMNRRGYQSNYMSRRGGYSYRGGGRGYSGPRRIIGELSAQPNQTLKSLVEEAFDFDEANRKFEQTSSKENSANAAGEGKENEKAPLTTPSVYDKSTSFFDRISCETLDRQAGHENRVDRSKQRQLDLETFGQSAAAPMRRGGRGYRRGMGNMIHTGGYYVHPDFQYGNRF